jgi:hypothetical protein
VRRDDVYGLEFGGEFGRGRVSGEGSESSRTRRPRVFAAVVGEGDFFKAIIPISASPLLSMKFESKEQAYNAPKQSRSRPTQPSSALAPASTTASLARFPRRHPHAPQSLCISAE